MSGTDEASDPPDCDGIAIIGIGCRYPGVHGPAAFWELIRSGRSTVSEPPEHRIALGYDVDRYFDARPRIPGRISSPYAGFLEHPECFDPAPFGLTPREVRGMEPQQRLAAEVAWDAIVDAGIPPDSLRGERVAVMFGHMAEDYSRERITVLGEDSVNRGLDVFTIAGLSRAVLTGRISYLLGLTGPSFTLDTACSSSLITTHLACQSLLSGESSLALAGGVNIFLTPEGNIALSRSGMLAEDGRCKAFDARADGFVRAEGAGAVLLRPLRDALLANDPIYAVIRGSGISTDGRDGGHMMAPGRHGQAQAMRDAYARAGVSPADVDFVETHGTGTPIGDPIEIGALADVMGPGRPADRPLRVSSVKGNIGHAESASGVAGLIKAALALTHRELPKQLHFSEPSPNIPWDEIPVRVQTEHEAWPGRGPRLAAVNSFGISGTNAHLVLQSPPERRVLPALQTDEAPRPMLFPFSAHDAPALEATLAQYAEQLRGDAVPTLRDLAYTLGQRRQHHTHRFAVVASTPEALADELDSYRAGRPSGVSASGQASTRGAHELVLVFPGQGAQTATMGQELLGHEAVFRDKLEELDAAYARHVDWSLIDAIRDPLRFETFDRLSRLQPTLVAVEIAIAALWEAWGIRPDVVVGQSLGEIAAAHAAGCLDVDTVARLACHRGLMVERASGRGGMALLGLDETAVGLLLAPYAGRIEIAGSSSPDATIVSGDREPIERLVARLTSQEIFARRLEVDFASHCFHMDPLLDDFRTGIARLEPAAGSVPVYSTVERGPVDGEALDADYWVRNLRAPVAFTATLTRLIADGARQFVEVSPHPTLARAIPETAASLDARVQYLPSLVRQRGERASMRAGLAQLFVTGTSIDFEAEGPSGHVLNTAPYPYQRRRFWFGERKRSDLRRQTHEWLGPRMDVSIDRGMALWQKTLDLDAAPWLSDYQVDGKPTLPAALYIELALAVARETWPERPITLHDLTVWPLLILDESVRATLQISLRQTGPNGGDLCIMSREDATSEWTRRASCRLTAPPDVGSDARPSTTTDRFTGETLGSDDWHTDLRDRGLTLGRRLRSLRSLTHSKLGARASLELPRVAESESYACFAHPALLEPCLILAGGTREASTVTAIDEIRFSASLTTELACEVSYSTVGEDRAAKLATIRIRDAEGDQLLSLRGVRTKSIGHAASALLPAPVSLHPIEWRRLELPAPGQLAPGASWILCGDDDLTLESLATELQKRGFSCRRRSLSSRASQSDTTFEGSSGFLGLALLLDRDAIATAHSATTRLDDLVSEVIGEGAALDAIWLIAPGSSGSGGEIVKAAPPEHILQPRTRQDDTEPSARVWLTLDPAASGQGPARVADWMSAFVSEPRLVERHGAVWAPRLAEEIATQASAESAAGFESAGDRNFAARVVAPGESSGVELRAEPLPTPRPREVRIAVHTAALSGDAIKHTLGIPAGAASGDTGLRGDLVGRITAVGSRVSNLRVGDRIVGSGPIARNTCLDAGHVVQVPDSVDSAAAASHVHALAVAATALEDKGALRAGQTVVVHKAESEIGAAALALAQAAGAEVLAVTASAEHAASLAQDSVAVLRCGDGANLTAQILDATANRGADIVVNTEARIPIDGGLRAVRPGGQLIDVYLRDASDTGPIEGLRVRGNRSFRAVDLDRLAEESPQAFHAGLVTAMARLEAATLELPEPVVFRIGDLGRALRYLAHGRSRGRVIVTLDGAEALPIRTADGRPRLFDESTTYGLVCSPAHAAGPLSDWMRERGAGEVLVLNGDTAAANLRAIQATRGGVILLDTHMDQARDAGSEPCDSTPAATLPTPAVEALSEATDLGFCVMASPATLPGATATTAERTIGASLAKLASNRRAAGLPITEIRLTDPARSSIVWASLEEAIRAPASASPYLALARDGRDAPEIDRGAPLFDEIRVDMREAGSTHALRAEITALSPPERVGRVLTHLIDAIALVLGMADADRARIAPESALDELGLDSLMTLELAIGLHRDLGVELERGALGPGKNLRTIAETIADELCTHTQGESG